ncbi:MAG TPA: ATP synthase F1 subunit gamma [Anaerolineae bacterium]|nr:ATP synthase F1 subunit gamma [Anaerolineae bacterium]MCB0180581.1 ATP synthase F1 subunit gamma [Anaerolineae bacterium]MCB9102973.1 ATP synthase F1 subunit gamma [Anaerolineales bacterium]HRV94900.1 ATP synthase F1 subunit gamma [Anaerolineae bacterium]
MASVREIKRRIKSVKNISQVTRAMQMIAASRMRRAQEQALASRPYAAKAWELLMHFAAQGIDVEQLHPLLARREVVKNVGIILITADKGLAGGYNGNVIRKVTRYMQSEGHEDASIVAVGKKGRDFMLRFGRKVIAEFTDLPPRPTSFDVAPIARLAIDGFLNGEFDEVHLAYTDFINTLTQTPTIRLLLPIQPSAEQMSEVMRDYITDTKPMTKAPYIYEPDPETLLDAILPSLTELQIYQAVLESRASEESARMVAMRNATENAKELIGDLTLTYNKARQAAITKEMLDIAGGAEALSQASK